VAQIEEDGVHVMFSCRCMTHDETETKFWYNGEYESLDPMTLDEKLLAHATHCPFGVQFAAAAFSDSTIVYEQNTLDM
jgi:hypothetical protein